MILLFLIGSAAGQTLSFTVIANYRGQKPKSIFFGINNTVVMFSGFIVPIIIGVLVNSFNLDILFSSVNSSYRFFSSTYSKLKIINSSKGLRDIIDDKFYKRCIDRERSNSFAY